MLFVPIGEYCTLLRQTREWSIIPNALRPSWFVRFLRAEGYCLSLSRSPVKQSHLASHPSLPRHCVCAAICTHRRARPWSYYYYYREGARAQTLWGPAGGGYEPGYLIRRSWSVITTINQSVFHLRAHLSLSLARSRNAPGEREGGIRARECARVRVRKRDGWISWGLMPEWKGLAKGSLSHSLSRVIAANQHCSPFFSLLLLYPISRLGLSVARSITLSKWSLIWSFYSVTHVTRSSSSSTLFT